ncbi:MAG: hypothetical protein NC411_01850 [Bacteroides sp.]|nr:hypothetical protein [Bacteroides sp.]
MDEALNHYLRSLADPDIPVGISDVERLMKEYPFFTLPALTLMQREGKALPAETRSRLLGHIALNAPDPATFAALTDSERDTWLNFYPPEKKEPVTTDNVIDTFLATYGHSSPQEDAMLERLIFNPTADYSVILSKEEEESLPPEPSADDDPQDALINAFIRKNRSESGHATQPETAAAEAGAEDAGHAAPATPTDHPIAVTSTTDDSSLSESLAKIYIRRRRYDKAFEIIHSLSLNNPKKSVYFADQLRFLRKLMLNSSLSDDKKITR